MEPLYDSIGNLYGATRRADPTIARTLARLVDAGRDASFLDLACGTGNYTCALAALGGRWHGIDISDAMLQQASARSREIDWRQGSADALPYDDRSFSGAICTLAIHHFPALHAPFKEVFRVLDEGAFVIFTAFPEQMRSYWLRHYFPAMMERSIEQMPARRTVLDALSDAGFAIDEIVPFNVTNDLEDLFLYAGKERPGLYLDPIIRANISSFAALSSEEELRTGLERLARDIENGSFHDVARRYAGSDGDYAFVVARKGKGC